MTNRPKNIGTAAETAVLRVARSSGFPWAERLTLSGANDRGDISLIPGPAIILEVKGGQAAKTASDAQLEAWLDETECERTNAGAAHGFLVVQRRGVGAPNARRWWAWWRTGWLPTPAVWPEDIPVRMQLGDALNILRGAGYGEPLEGLATEAAS